MGEPLGDGVVEGTGTDGGSSIRLVVGVCDAEAAGVGVPEDAPESEGASAAPPELPEPPPARSRVIEQAPSPALRARAQARATSRRTGRDGAGPPAEAPEREAAGPSEPAEERGPDEDGEGAGAARDSGIAEAMVMGCSLWIP